MSNKEVRVNTISCNNNFKSSLRAFGDTVYKYNLPLDTL